MDNIKSLLGLFYDYLIDDNWVGEIHPDEKNDNIDHFIETKNKEIFEILKQTDNK